MDYNQEDARGQRSRRVAPPPVGTGLGSGLRRVAARFVGGLRGPAPAPTSSSRVRGLQISPPLETLRGRPPPLIDIARTDDVDIGEQLWASSAVDAETAAARARAHAQLTAGSSHSDQPPPPPPKDVVVPLMGYDIHAWQTTASALPVPNTLPTFDLLTASDAESRASPQPLDVHLIGENREIDIDMDLLGPSVANASLSVVTGPWRRHSIASSTSLAESYSYTVDSLSVDGASGSSRSISRMTVSTGDGSGTGSSSSKSSRATSFRTRSTPSALSLVGPWRANLVNETASRSSNGLRLYDLDEEEQAHDDAASGRPLLPAAGPASPAAPGPRIVGGHSFSATTRFANRSHAEAALAQGDQIGSEQWPVPPVSGGGLRRAATTTRRRLVIANAAPTDPRFSSSTQGSLPVLPQPLEPTTAASGSSSSSLRRTATVAGAAANHHTVPAGPVPVPDSRRGPASVPRRVLFVANSGPSDRGRRGGSSSGSSSGRSRRSTWSSASSGAAR